MRFRLFFSLVFLFLLAGIALSVTAHSGTGQRHISQIFTPIYTVPSTVDVTSIVQEHERLTSTPTPKILDADSVATSIASPAATEELDRIEHYVLSRPIPREINGLQRVDWVDRSYPYGDTQLGLREVHLGVEFVNPRFTPIHAAADGVILFAGDDSERRVGPYTGFYGNVIVVSHFLFSPEKQSVYTVYGHLESISVETGQVVQGGDELGKVGSSGIAIGAHLHFEVRVGADPFDPLSTRNPELWIQPYENSGTLAGRVMDEEGQELYGVLLRIRSETSSRDAFSYANEFVSRDLQWQENFVTGDLPAGEYKVVVRDEEDRTLFRETVEIEAGKTTWLDAVLPVVQQTDE